MKNPFTTSLDHWLLANILILVVLGLVVLMSATSSLGYAQFQDSYYFIKHQVIFGMIPGLFLLFIASVIPYLFWKKHALIFFIATLALLVLVFVPGVRANIGTAHSWITVFGLFSVQPSEIAKLTFLFYLSALFTKKDVLLHDQVKKNIIPFLTSLGILSGFLLVQPDLGTSTILVMISFSIFFVALAPWKYVISLITAGVGMIALFISLAPYRAQRFTVFLHPELDPRGIGYHINQALLAIGTGGWFGLGYGNSRQKYQYLPEVGSDSIFAIFAEEMGFFASIMLIFLILSLCLRLLYLAKKTQDPFGQYVLVGIACWIGFQSFVNIGSMLALLPMTGIPLPLVSYGGTSLAITMFALGVALNISKQAK